MLPKKIKQLEFFRLSSEEIKFLKMINEMEDIKTDFSYIKHELLNLKEDLKRSISFLSFEDDFLNEVLFGHKSTKDNLNNDAQKKDYKLDETEASKEDTVH